MKFSYLFNLSDFNLKSNFIFYSFHFIFTKNVLENEKYLSIIGYYFSCFCKAQTTNSAQQNSTVNADLHKTNTLTYLNPSAEVLVIKVNEPKTGMEFYYTMHWDKLIKYRL